jgi:hypothetical protein
MEKILKTKLYPKSSITGQIAHHKMIHHAIQIINEHKNSVVDPNRLCSDLDPAPESGAEKDPNKFGS